MNRPLARTDISIGHRNKKIITHDIVIDIDMQNADKHNTIGAIKTAEIFHNEFSKVYGKRVHTHGSDTLKVFIDVDRDLYYNYLDSEFESFLNDVINIYNNIISDNCINNPVRVFCDICGKSEVITYDNKGKWNRIITFAEDGWATESEEWFCCNEHRAKFMKKV